MGTGERRWDGVVAAAELWGWGCRSEADPKTGSSSDRHRAASAQPKSGVSIQSQLVWLYRTQDIYFKTFVSIFRLFFSAYFFLTYLFVIFEPFYCVGPWAGATGRPFLVKQRKGTGEFLVHLLTSPSHPRGSHYVSRKDPCWGFFLKPKALGVWVMTCLTD